MRKWLHAALEGARFYRCIIPRGWWKRPPFLPLPPYLYIKFRLDTAYGEVAHGWSRPKLGVLIKDTKIFLLWRKKFRRGIQ